MKKKWVGVFTASDRDLMDSINYCRFTKTDNYKGVPPPLSEDYSPKPEKVFDESLYVYGREGPQVPETKVSEDKSSAYSSCQSNDSARSLGNTSEPSKSGHNSVSSNGSMPSVVECNQSVVSKAKQTPVEPSCESHLKSPR